MIHVDEHGLVAAAHRAGCTLELVPVMGDFVMAEAPLFRVRGDPSRLDRERARRAVVLGTSGPTAMIPRTDSASWSTWLSARSARRRTTPRRQCR
ncbi:MAG TPA: DUF2254 family protein [Streptosporangiaceae bacterium]